MIFLLVFFIVLPVSIYYNFKHPPTIGQSLKRSKRRRTVLEILGVSMVTASVKLIKDKE